MDDRERPPSRAHDALSHRLRQAVGITDSEDDVADAYLVGTAKRNRRKRAEIDFQKREVGLLVDPDDLWIGDPPVSQLQADVARQRDNVVVGDQVSLGVNDDGGTHPGIDAKAPAGARAVAL